jgi:hypothetical protein
VPGTTNETVMAGTVYESINDHKTKVHFLYLDPASNVLTSKVYDDPNYIEERAIDIACPSHDVVGEQVFVITCLVKPDPILMPDDRSDRIKILVVRANGSIYSEDIIYAQEGKSLYPMHSVTAGLGVFICGYQTDGQYGIGEDPTTAPYGTKVAFVLGFNLPNRYLIGNARYFDYQYSSTSFFNGSGAPTAPQHDYDAAMRIIPIDFYPSDGLRFFIAGSVNAVRNTTGAYPIVQQEQKSASMVVLMDAYLNPPILNNGFRENDNISDNEEYSIGIAQDVSSIPYKNYVLGNKGIATNGRHTGTYITLNYLDNYLYHSTTAYSRYNLRHQDGAVALQTLPVISNYHSRLGIGIAGLAHQFTPNGCYLGGTYPEISNVSPFVAEANVSVSSGNISVNMDNWVTYLCRTGTGGSPMPNAYESMGEALTNMYTNPTFAARASENDDIMLSAPKLNGWWWYGTLAMKSIRAKFDDFTLTTCTDAIRQFTTHDECIGSEDYAMLTGLDAPGGSTTTPLSPTTPVTVNGITVNRVTGELNLVVGPSATTEEEYRNQHVVCDQPPTDTFYRQAPPVLIEVRESITLYPNPATDEVNIRVEGIAIEAQIRVDIYNIQGQMITTLYNGNVAEANRPLNIANLPSGLYLAKIYVDGKAKEQQKLIKE